jgi:hypothetical protein
MGLDMESRHHRQRQRVPLHTVPRHHRESRCRAPVHQSRATPNQRQSRTGPGHHDPRALPARPHRATPNHPSPDSEETSPTTSPTTTTTAATTAAGTKEQHLQPSSPPTPRPNHDPHPSHNREMRHLSRGTEERSDAGGFSGIEPRNRSTEPREESPVPTAWSQVRRSPWLTPFARPREGRTKKDSGPRRRALWNRGQARGVLGTLAVPVGYL